MCIVSKTKHKTSKVALRAHTGIRTPSTSIFIFSRFAMADDYQISFAQANFQVVVRLAAFPGASAAIRV
jgi:hypothetical protein